jgi:hypothetical protein
MTNRTSSSGAAEGGGEIFKRAKWIENIIPTFLMLGTAERIKLARELSHSFINATLYEFISFVGGIRRIFNERYSLDTDVARPKFTTTTSSILRLN